jgi:hypothetical protein
MYDCIKHTKIGAQTGEHNLRKLKLNENFKSHWFVKT